MKLNENNAIVWANLGAFYLKQNEIKLALECFKKSQAIEPEYGVAWIGQVNKNVFKIKFIQIIF